MQNSLKAHIVGGLIEIWFYAAFWSCVYTIQKKGFVWFFSPLKQTSLLSMKMNDVIHQSLRLGSSKFQGLALKQPEIKSWLNVQN